MALKLTGKRILILCSNFYPPKSGDSIFSFGFAKNLSEDNIVHVVTCSDLINQASITGLSTTTCRERLGVWRNLNRFISSFAIAITGKVEILGKLDAEYDCVIVDHLRSYGILRSLPKSIKYQSLYYVAHNVEYINQIQKTYFSKDLRDRIAALANIGVYWNEKRLAKMADRVFCLCEGDAYIYRNRFLAPDVDTVSLKFPFGKIDRTKAVCNSILFLGSLDWYPNRQGVFEFLQNCADLLGDEWEFNVVGECAKNIANDLQKDRRVKIHGFAENVDPFLEKTSVLVVPNRWGTGVKIKVYEALSKHVPVIVFKGADSGYESVKHESLYIVSDWNQLLDRLQKLGKNGRR